MSNDTMAKRKPSKKSPVEEPAFAYRSFNVTRGGRQKRYKLRTGYGYFIPSVKKAETLTQIREEVEAGITSKEIEPLIEFLDMKVSDIAKAASVSPSTVARWTADTSIGGPGSHQFFRIDEAIRKGVDLFGSPDELLIWLQNPNLALGNQTPIKLLTSQIGLDLVDEALDAMHYGNVM